MAIKQITNTPSISPEGKSIAKIREIRGKSLVWNQLFRPISSSYWAGVSNATVTFNDGEATVTLTKDAVSQYTGFIRTQPIQLYTHKYYIAFDILLSKGTSLVIDTNNASLTKIVTGCSTGTWNRASTILSVSTEKTTYVNIYPREQTEGYLAGDYYKLRNAILIDLTLMFGAGNEPATVEEFKAMFPLPYYDYNPGEIISNKTESIGVTGRNVWDEEWEVGDIFSDGVNIPSTTRIRTKNFIEVFPGKAYYYHNPNQNPATASDIFYYDNNQVFIGKSTNFNLNAIFSIPSGCYYIRFVISSRYGTTYKNDICINLSDPSFNGTYEPYKKSTFPLNISTLTGKLNGEGESITIFPNGMRSAGSVYDYLIVDEDGYARKAIVAIWSVDMGTLTWNYDSQYSVFLGGSLSTKAGLNCASTKYSTANVASSSAKDKSVYLRNESRQAVGVKDSSYTSAADFQSAMSGVELVYELATPLEYVLDTPILMEYNTDGGTEQIVFSENLLSTPLVTDVDYFNTAIKHIQFSDETHCIRDERITGVDYIPIENSTNVVTSAGVYNQLTKRFDHICGGWCAGSGSYWGKIFEYAYDKSGTVDNTSTFLFTEYGTTSNGYSAILMIDVRGNSKNSISNIKANWVYKTSDTIENTIKVTHCYQNNTFYIRIYAYSTGWSLSIAGTLLQSRAWSASSRRWSGFEATFTGNNVETFSQIPTDETLVTITNKIIEASGFKTPNGTSSQFLKADGSVDSNSYLTSHQSLSNYVKIDPGAAEQTIKSGIGLLNKGVINLYRDTGDHFTFLGFSNGTTEKYLGGIGFKSQSNHELYLKLASSTNTPSETYYKILNENNHAAPGVTAGTAGTSSATSGATLAVPYVTVNSAGHVTGYGTHTHTISASDILNGTSTQFVKGDGSFDSNSYLPENQAILSRMQDDATHRTVTDTDKTNWNNKQSTLISGSNIKTINNTSLLGSGNISIPSGKSAYDIWLDAGNTGTASDFLESLKGSSGYSGAAGELQVVNDLTTGGSTSALSAEMGKLLADAIGAPTLIDLNEITTISNGYAISSTTKLWSSRSNSKYILIPVENFYKVTVTTNSSGVSALAWLKDTPVPVEGETPNYSEGTSLWLQQANTIETYTVPTDAKFLYSFVAARYPAKVIGIKYNTTYNKNQFEPNLKTYSPITGSYINVTTYKWDNQNSTWAHIMIPNANYQSVTVKSNSSYGSRIAFLTNNDETSGSTPSYAENTSLYKSESGETNNYLIPSSTNWIYIYTGVDYGHSPESVVFYTDDSNSVNSIINTSSENDFEIVDENKNPIVVFNNGHIKTLNFDSSKLVKTSNYTRRNFFSYNVNCTNFLTTNFTASSINYYDPIALYEDNAILYLPASYSNQGPKTKLIIYCKEGSTYMTEDHDSILTNPEATRYFLYQGYAILAADGVPDGWKEALKIGERAVGNYVAVQSTLRAFEYVKNNYNIDCDNVFIFGYSQGGMYAENVIDNTDLPVRAAVLLSPALSMRYHQWDAPTSQTINGTSYTKGARLNIARIFNFPEVTTNAQLLALEYDPDKVCGYDPWVRNVDNPYTDFVKGTSVGTELWGLPTGASLDSITMKKYTKCPTKIWVAENDNVLGVDITKVFVKAIRNTGQVADLQLFSTGEHHIQNYQTAIRTFVENGENVSLLPLYLDMAAWYYNFGGLELK